VSRRPTRRLLGVGVLTCGLLAGLGAAAAMHGARFPNGLGWTLLAIVAAVLLADALDTLAWIRPRKSAPGSSLSALGLWQRRASNLDGAPQRRPRAEPRVAQAALREALHAVPQHMLLLVSGRAPQRPEDRVASHRAAIQHACVQLAEGALRSGDAVGWLSGKRAGWSFQPPRSGLARLAGLRRAIAEMQLTDLENDPRETVRQLLEYPSGRALVVWILPAKGRDDEQLLSAARLLARYHRVWIVTLQEGDTEQRLRTPVVGASGALEYCRAVERSRAREALNLRLKARGVQWLHVHPQQLGEALLGRYYESAQRAPL
jgi:LmbE family N-acetylglucosaminyl deacetylase